MARYRSPRGPGMDDALTQAQERNPLFKPSPASWKPPRILAIANFRDLVPHRTLNLQHAYNSSTTPGGIRT